MPEDESRGADRWRRLSGAERGDPRGQPAGARPRRQGGRRPPWLAWTDRRPDGRARRARHLGNPAPRRHHPANLPHQSLRPRRRRVERVLAGLWQLDALVAIGGEDTLGVAARLHAEHGCHIVGVPKTIDNDIAGTDVTFGFDTAVSIATEAIDRLHSTAESHDRVMVCEVMGRHTGWIALTAGMAGGADMILIPELPLTVERCCEVIRRRHARGKDFSIVVVSEGWELRFESGEARMVASVETDELRARAPGRHRRRAGPRDRGAHRVRDPRDHARPRPARRHPDRARPGAGDPLRPQGRGAGLRRPLGRDGRPAGVGGDLGADPRGGRSR